MVSPAIAGRPQATEIYNSALDTSNSDGLPKAGAPLDAGTSATASDHYAVFADLELDADFPNLQLSLTAQTVVENSPVGTVAAQVTLPAVRTVPVTVALASDDAAAAMPAESTVVIPAGSLTAQVALVISPRNFIAEGQRSVSLMASATGYDPSSAVLQVEDADLPYGFQIPGETVVENFAGFTGLHDPAPWLTTGGQPWLGSDDGASALPGWRVYGSGPGFLTDGGLASISTVIENRSPTPLTALDVALDAGQWRAVMDGAAERMHVDLVTETGTIPLPGLTFTASQALPSGPVPGGAAIRLSAMAAGLWIPPGGSFGLRVSFVPAMAAGRRRPMCSSTSFIMTTPVRTPESSWKSWWVLALAGCCPISTSCFTTAARHQAPRSIGSIWRRSFTPGATSSGYRFFSVMLPPDGIQNGGNDGFAVVNKATSQVLHLISYEGVFTAAGGPAAGMTSTSIGVSQNGTETPGEAALGLTAAGPWQADFTWTKFFRHRPFAGPAEPGQIFVTPTLPRQGLGFDNLAVTFLTDNDLDGLPDIADPDDDNDGQSDDDEIAFGSGPLNPASRFAPVIARTASGLELSFPGAQGIAYTIEFSETLGDWHDLTTVTGQGNAIIVPLPMAEPAMFFRVRAAGPGS